jgi:hypothetical protein
MNAGMKIPSRRTYLQLKFKSAVLGRISDIKRAVSGARQQNLAHNTSICGTEAQQANAGVPEGVMQICL